MNVKEELDEGMDEPMTWEVGEESGIYPTDTDDNTIGASDLSVLNKIEKISDTEYKFYASYGEDEDKVEFDFTASEGAKIELSMITCADCMLGYGIENVLFNVNKITDNSIEVQCIGIER